MGDLKLSKVFIIGAGFSKGIADYPTSNELMTEICFKAEKYKQKESNYFRFANDFIKVYNYFSEQLKNNLMSFQEILNKDKIEARVDFDKEIDIEYLITFIDLNLEKQVVPKVKGIDCKNYPLLFIDSLSPEEFKNAKKFIQIMLFEVLRPNTDKYPIKWDAIKKFVELISPTDTIITFNYDLLLEQVLMQNKLWNPSQGYTEFDITQISKERDFNNYPDKKITLIKLHGSINWENRGLIDDNNLPYYFLCDRCTGEPLTEEFNAQLKVRIKEPHYVPDSVFIYPSFIKKFSQEHEQKMITKSINKITKAQKVFIFGYSLPEADTTANILFSQLPKHIEIEAVLFNDETHFEKRMKENFSFKNFKYYSTKIEDWLISGYTCKEYELEKEAEKVFEISLNTKEIDDKNEL